MKEELGKRIKMALKKAKVSQRNIAGILHVHETTVSGYCSGRAEPPSQGLRIIAETCNVSLDWLITGEGEMERAPVAAELGEEYGNDIMIRINRSGLPEPVKKSIKVLMENEDMAWELYATILERAERKRGKGQE